MVLSGSSCRPGWGGLNGLLAHWKHARTTNLIERSCLKWAFGVIEWASRRWQRVTVTGLEPRQLQMLREELDPDPPPGTRRTDTFAAWTPMPQRFYSRFRT